jgi:hypothetical protein
VLLIVLLTVVFALAAETRDRPAPVAPTGPTGVTPYQWLGPSGYMGPTS